jgi:hypothetical protein
MAVEVGVAVVVSANLVVGDHDIVRDREDELRDLGETTRPDLVGDDRFRD